MRPRRLLRLSALAAPLALACACSAPPPPAPAAAPAPDYEVVPISTAEEAAAGAEAAFAALEERLLSAPVAMRFHITSEGAFASELAGTLRMEGDVARLEARGTFGADSARLHLAADADSVRGGNGERIFAGPTPPALREALALGLTRMGLLHNLARLVAASPPDHAEGGAGEWVGTEGHAWVEGGEAGEMRFGIVVDGTDVAEATLRLDPATGLPAVRTQTVRFPGGEMRVVERYEWEAAPAGARPSR